ncbi:AmmeMemoRadiSam system protein B [Candidatus Woesearchaeota archaeon]|nr:MAG: AmmeMemoRadiSam system protein B [Candidatus Woesearchaeota archaeon]
MMGKEIVRKPIASGQFYPDNFTQLDEFITTCFTGSKGPAAVSSRGIEDVQGILVPHDKYAFSGPTCAWGYAELAKTEAPQTVIILAPALSGSTTCISNQDFETPFGRVACDVPLAKAMIEQGIPLNNYQHGVEHQIEVQIPFVQYVYRKHLNKLKLIPLLIGDQDPEEIIEKLRGALEQEPRRVKWIISTNLTHYGPGYHYLPFELDVEQKLEELDRTMISLINTPQKLLEYVHENSVQWFGLNSILIAKAFLGEAQLVHYTNTGKILGEWKNVVSYAALKFV